MGMFRYYRFNPAEAIPEKLKQLLAETYVLYVKTQGCHWNVEGSNFAQLHQLFENQYEELRDAIDVIAEHLRTFGVISPGSLQEFSALSGLDEVAFSGVAQSFLSGRSLVQTLLNGNKQVAETARELAELATADPSTEHLAVDRIQAHEKAAWMLQSSLRP